MARKRKWAYSKTGGASGAADAIDGNDLTAGDVTEVFDTVYSPYIVDSSGDAESSPLVIAPDSNPGSKRHKLVGALLKTLTLSSGATVDEIVTSISGGGADDQLPTAQAVAELIAAQAGVSSVHPGFMVLPKFSYNGGSTAYTVSIGPSRGYCKDKYYYHTSSLTSQAISGAVADTWYYLYLDYSAMTDGVALTNTETYWSTTAPTYNGTYDQMMNGDDRFLFPVLVNSTPDNIIPFNHIGGRLTKFDNDTAISDYATAAPTSWTAQTITAPDFNEDTEVLLTFMGYSGHNTTYYARKTGSSSTEGEIVARTYYDGNIYGDVRQWDVNTCSVVTDASQSIDIKASGGYTLHIHTLGFYLPRGMGK